MFKSVSSDGTAVQSTKLALLAGVGLMVLAPLTPALAQSAAPAKDQSFAIEEVVVTAQKREEFLQDVPIAVTAVTGAALEAKGVNSSMDLTNVVPGLNFTQAVGVYGLPVIRSIGTTSHGPGVENPVATYIDGVYMASASTSLMSLSDVAQVAILKGPQGTLFGRNATGGLIQITTKTPSRDFSGDVALTAGNVGSSAESLYLTGGLSDTLAANLAISNSQQSKGFGRNLYTGQYVGTQHSTAVRGKLLWRPDDNTDVTLSADYSKFHGALPLLRAVTKTIFNAPMAGGFHDVNLNVQPFSRAKQTGVSLTARHEFEKVQVLSITGYRESDVSSLFDADSTASPILAIDLNQSDRQLTQEFQILSTGDTRLSWVAGVFGMKGEGRYDPLRTLVGAAPGPIESSAKTKLTSYAIFGQATYKIDDATNFTAGLRYSSDKRHLNSSQVMIAPFGTVPTAAPQDVSKTFSDPTWRLSLDHRFSPRFMTYVSYNRGFRSGTFVPDLYPTKVLKPEVLDAVETGFKADLLDRRLRLNAAAFYYDYRNRQVLAIVNGVEVVYTAEKAVTYGLDADLEFRVTSDLSLTGGLSLIHAEYKTFSDALFSTLNPFGGATLASANADGKKLEATPDWTVNFGPTYHMSTSAGELTATVNYYRNSGWYAGPDNRQKQKAYDTVSASLLWVPSFSKNLTVQVWGKNLGDTDYATQLTQTAFSDNAEPAAGRTYGVTLGAHF